MSSISLPPKNSATAAVEPETRCLVVEADDVWAAMLQRALLSIGVRVSRASDHDHALDQVLADKFDVVTLDLSLDREKRFNWGKNLLAALKTRDAVSPPIIIVSGTQDIEDVAVAVNEYRKWVYHFAPKEPWDVLRFLKAVQALTHQNETRTKDARHTRMEPAIARLRRLSDRFHSIVQKLEGTLGMRIRNEYDVQRLLTALLTADFDDVRSEDPAPIKAGAPSRIDFVLPEHGIAIETKMTRKGLTSKKLGEELIIDVARYQSHPQCLALFCFVYDPQAMIINPRGLERDLMQQATSIHVEVAIRP